MLVDFNAGAADVFAERSGVRGERQLTVAEVIARHQARQRAQDALVRNYVAQVRMEQHFRPTMTDPGYDVVTENRYFVTGADVEWEELSFSVNGSTWGSDRPPFPLLQPEKVLSLPLLLRFDEGYRYRLDGTERVDGYDCYVVRFEPLEADASLYTGTIWIDRKTFVRIRVQAVQGGLAAPVVSNEEIQRYTPPVMVGESGGVSVQRPHRPADHADRGPEPSGREERDVHRFHGQRSRHSKMRARPPGRATT